MANIRKTATPPYSAMILVDTSILIAWLDDSHKDHEACLQALQHWAGQEELAVSSVTYGEFPGAR